MNRYKLFLLLVVFSGLNFQLFAQTTVCNNGSSSGSFDLTPPANICLSKCNRAWVWNGTDGTGLSDPNAGSVMNSISSGSEYFNYTITWNPSFVGYVKFIMDEYKYGGNINNKDLIKRHEAAFCRITPGQSNAVLSTPSVEVEEGQAIFLTLASTIGCNSLNTIRWYVKDKNAADNTYQLYSAYNGNFNFTYNTTTVGHKTFKATFNSTCGYSGQSTVDVNILPSCYNDDLTAIINSSTLQSYGGSTFEIVLGGFADDGGYRVNAGESYVVNIPNIPDIWDDYTLSFNAPSGSGATGDVTITSPNRFTINSNVQIGSYRIDLVKTNDPESRCPDIPSFKVFVGGSDQLFREPCIIILPDYLFGPPPKIDGLTSIDDIILRHFSYTVISEQAVIARPGMTLVNGAQLKIGVANDKILIGDPDFNLNIVENTEFDDYGNVVESSRQYFDEMGRPTQLQEKNINSGLIMASELLYDQYGRPSLQTLPAPVSYRTSNTNTCGGTALPWENLDYSYKNNFITTTSGSKYRYNNFDGSKEGNPDLLSTTTPGTLGWYYSNNNIAGASAQYSEPFVAKTNYPFAKTEFYNDGTGEVKRIVTPGDIYRSVSGHINTSIGEKSVITSGDLDVAGYIIMRNEAFPNDANAPTNLFENAFKFTTINPQGIANYDIIDQAGNVIISVHNGSVKTITYNFFDDVGRLRFSITPNGVAAYSNGNFNTIDKTIFEYDYRGFLSAVTKPDEGRVENKYRKDGKIRFSQNQVQRLANPERYTYINYDLSERAVESGEYVVTDVSAIAWNEITTSILESTSNDGGLSAGVKRERIYTFYDGENGTLVSPITQDFVVGKISCTSKEGVSTTWYTYDERDRVVEFVQYVNDLAKSFKTSYKFDPKGSVKEVAYQDGETDAFYHYYEYNNDGRLNATYSGTVKPVYNNSKVITNLASLIKQATYEFYHDGALKRMELADKLQGIDYVYTIEGNLKSINNPSNLVDKVGYKNDIFSMTLDYYAGDYTKTGTNIKSLSYSSTDRFDGNVKGVNWKNHTLSLASYGYNYNDKGLLTSAIFGSPNYTNNTAVSSTAYSENTMNYDLNGNITDLLRTGAGGSQINNFIGKYNYTAHNNKLNGITGYSDYTYNEKGQMVEEEDLVTGAKKKLTYDVGEMVTNIKDENDLDKASFLYDDAGERICKITYNASGQPNLYVWYIRDATGNVISTYEQTSTSAPLNQSEISIYGVERVGTVFRNGNVYDYTYELTDNLGNVRATIHKDLLAGAVNVLSYFDYYPYGMVNPDRSLNSSFGNRHTFQGIYSEKDEESEYDNFYLRNYNSTIARWLSPDPYGQFFSPYIGMGANPANGVDPDGGWLSVRGYSGFEKLWLEVRINIKFLFSGNKTIDVHNGQVSGWTPNINKTINVISYDRRLTIGSVVSGFIGAWQNITGIITLGSLPPDYSASPQWNLTVGNRNAGNGTTDAFLIGFNPGISRAQPYAAGPNIGSPGYNRVNSRLRAGQQVTFSGINLPTQLGLTSRSQPQVRLVKSDVINYRVYWKGHKRVYQVGTRYYTRRGFRSLYVRRNNLLNKLIDMFRNW